MKTADRLGAALKSQECCFNSQVLELARLATSSSCQTSSKKVQISSPRSRRKQAADR